MTVYNNMYFIVKTEKYRIIKKNMITTYNVKYSNSCYGYIQEMLITIKLAREKVKIERFVKVP